MQRLIHCFTRRNPDETVNGINQLMNKRRLNLMNNLNVFL